MRTANATFLAALFTLGTACFTSNPLATEDTPKGTTSASSLDTTETAGPSGAAEGSMTTSSADPDNTSSTPPSSASSSSSTEGTTAAETSEQTCAAGERCTPRPPRSWRGPYIIANGTSTAKPRDCPTGTEEHGNPLLFGLVAPAARCVCSCSDPSGVACGSTTLEFYGGDSTCTGAPNASYSVLYGGNGGTCIDGPNSGGSRFWRAEPLNTTDGNCEPEENTEVEVGFWEGETRACALTSRRSERCGRDGFCSPSDEVGHAY